MATNPERGHTEARRRLIKSLAAGGAIGAAVTLPEKWAKPVIDAVIVPLHAQTSPVPINPILLAGIWTGSWTDTVLGTSGSATMTVTVDTGAQTFQISLDLNGPVLGSSDPGPQPFSGTYTAAAGNICCQVVPRFGVPTIAIGPTGAIVGNLAPLPEIGSIQIAGTITHSSLTIAYTAVVGPASTALAGTLTMSK